MSELARASLALVAIWTVVVVVHALWAARDADRNPAPPQPPEPHAHH